MGTITTYPDAAPPVAVPGITLGYAQRTSDIAISGIQDLGLSVSVVVPAGRRIRISAEVYFISTVADDVAWLGIYEGSSPQLQSAQVVLRPANQLMKCVASVVISPTAGVHNYKLFAQRTAGSGTITCGSGAFYPAYILVEDITGFTQPVPPANIPVGQLAYAQITANWTSGTTTLTDVPGLSVNVVVPAGRTLRISAFVAAFYGFSAASYVEMQLLEGATTLQLAQSASAAGLPESLVCDVVLSPTAGAHTYKVAVKTNSGTFSLGASANWPAFILVEDITATPAPANSAPSSTLGYAETTTAQTGMTGTHDLTGLSVTVTVPVGRRLRVRGFVRAQNNTASCGLGVLILQDGVTVNADSSRFPVVNEPFTLMPEAILSPSAGTHTYKLQAQVQGGGTAITVSSSTSPAFILVEDVTAVSTYAINPQSILPGVFQTGAYIIPQDGFLRGEGTPGANHDWLQFQKVGTISASNILYSFSHRSNNTDLWLYGYNGSSFGAGSFFVQPYFTAAQGATITGDLVVNGTGYQQFAGTLSGASIGALKTVGQNVNGIACGNAGGGFTLRAKNASNNIQFDWNGGFQMWVDVTNVKTFVIDHPLDAERHLVHACIEGPEAAVIYRGQSRLVNGWVQIDLPEYFEALCSEEGRSVQLTCIADDPRDEWCPVLHATYPKNGRFWVGLGSGMVINDQRFWWEVKAIRKDVPPLTVAPLKSAVEVLGSGPYTYAKER